MLALTRVALVRLVRDRTNVFFLLLFPLLLVLLLGTQFGGEVTPRLGVVGFDGEGDATLRTSLESSFELVDLADSDDARSAVETGDVDAAVTLDRVGDTVAVTLLANPDGSDVAIRAEVDAVVGELDADVRSRRALVATGAAADEPAAGALLDAVAGDGPEVTTTVLGAGGLAEEFAGLGRFDLGASSQLLLFVFITSLTGSAAVVQARRWGILDRVLAGPTSATSVILGLGLGQLAVALVQAVVIVVATAALFGVRWGDPLATGAVILLFSVVSAAAGLLLGSLLDNEEQAGGVGVPLALVLAALGGSMVPLELFPDALVPVSRFTPHAWGNLALAEIVRRDADVVDVLPQLGMLTLFAVLLGGTAAWRLRGRIARG